MTRVATGFQATSILKQLQQTSSSMAESSYQISTGFKSKNLSGIADDANRLLDLRDLQRNGDIYTKNIETAQARLRSTESTLNGMVDLLVEASQLWTLGRTEQSPEARASLAPKAESLSNTFYNLMHTQFDGRYILSGQAGERPPLSTNLSATAYDPGNPNPTDYYNADSTRASVITGPGNATDYGLTGDADAFAKLKAGMEALWYGLENNSEADIDGAIGILESAQQEVSELLGQVGGELSNMTLVKDRHSTNNDILQERIDELNKVDIADAMTRFTQEQAAIQASMLVLTQLNQTSLLNFL